jgi:hypothetical protein
MYNPSPTHPLLNLEYYSPYQVSSHFLLPLLFAPLADPFLPNAMDSRKPSAPSACFVTPFILFDTAPFQIKGGKVKSPTPSYSFYNCGQESYLTTKTFLPSTLRHPLLLFWALKALWFVMAISVLVSLHWQRSLLNQTRTTVM